MRFVKSDEPHTGPAPAAAAPTSDAACPCFRLLHLSDPHLFAGETTAVRDFFGKRLLGYISWRLHRRAGHRHAVMAALHGVLGTAPVDHIVVTGDATHLSLPGDFEAAREFLQDLGPPERVTLIPGNHDAYVAARWRQRLGSVKPYLASDAPDSRHAPPSGAAPPSVRMRGEVAIIGVHTARPTSPLFATGTVGKNQLQRLEAVLKQTAAAGWFRLVLIHHPPVAGLAGWRRRLTDLAAFGAVVRRQGAELVLHGHTHRFSEAAIEGPDGKIAVLGVPSITALSAAQHRAGFRLFAIHSHPERWTTDFETYRYAATRQAFESLGSRRLSIPRPKSPAADTREVKPRR